MHLVRQNMTKRKVPADENPFQVLPENKQIFQGVHILFWLNAHTSKLRKRAASFGAVVEEGEEIGPQTSHVICKPDMSLMMVRDKLLKAGAQRAAHDVTVHGECAQQGRRLWARMHERMHFHVHCRNDQKIATHSNQVDLPSAFSCLNACYRRLRFACACGVGVCHPRLGVRQYPEG